MAIDLNIRLVPIPGIPKRIPPSPLGLLAPLAGKWQGQGFNQIWRPFDPQSASDHFLELNLTNETLDFTEIPGEIPNRGLLQQDISLFGLTYLQQVADANVKDTNGNPAGIHIEPGIWINIPATANPQEQTTVARLANIPHGTSLVAQGTATVVAGPPQIGAVDITPFFIGQPANKVPFPNESTLTTPSAFRSPPGDLAGVTQTMVNNPNSVLTAALLGKTINSHTRIDISTLSGATTTPNAGGGISDIAFLEGTAGGPNARVAQMSATFWISDYTDAQGSGTILQYSQIVLLNFAPLSWPHISVATLVKQRTKAVIKDVKDSKVEIKELKEHKVETKEHKVEIKEIEVPVHVNPPIPDPGPAGPAAAAPAQGRHFILPEERPAVGDAAAKDPAAKPPKQP